MNTIDLAPLYRSSIGFDQFGNLLDSAMHYDQDSQSYPPYNIEVIGEGKYNVCLAVAGFEREDLTILLENNVLSVSGKKSERDNKREYLYQGIGSQNFKHQFTLADHVEVAGADLRNGLLTINLVKEIPETMKPKRIPINASNNVYELETDKENVA